jgi:hypothetical protein
MEENGFIANMLPNSHMSAKEINLKFIYFKTPIKIHLNLGFDPLEA